VSSFDDGPQIEEILWQKKGGRVALIPGVKVPLDITHEFKHRSMIWFEFRKRKVQEGGGERDTGKSRSAVILQDTLQR
jgi:hypothetical protein